MKQRKALKLFARTRTGPQLPTIGVTEAIAISNRTLICDAMLLRLETRENAHLAFNYSPWQRQRSLVNRDYGDYHTPRTPRALVPVDRAAYREHVIAYCAWRAGWIRTINKHRPTRNERRAARKTLATKEN